MFPMLGRFWGMLGRFMGMDGRAMAGRFWGMAGLVMPPPAGRAMPPPAGRAMPPPAGRAMPPPAGRALPPPAGRAMPPPPGRAPPLPRWAWAGSAALKRVSNPMRGMSCRRLNMNILERRIEAGEGEGAVCIKNQTPRGESSAERLFRGFHGGGRLGSGHAGLGCLANHQEVDDVRGDLAANDAVDRVGLDRILVPDRMNLGGRSWPAVPQHPLRLHDPLVLVGARPETLAMAAFRVEIPGLDLARLGVPADEHRAGRRLFTLDLGIVGSDEVAVVVGPADIGLNLVVAAVINPVADHPLQLLEPLIGGDILGRGREFSDLGRLPLAVLANQERAEARELRSVALGRGKPRLSFHPCDVGRDEPDFRDLRFELQSRILLEGSRIHLGDGRLAAGLASFWIGHHH